MSSHLEYFAEKGMEMKSFVYNVLVYGLFLGVNTLYSADGRPQARLSHYDELAKLLANPIYATFRQVFKLIPAESDSALITNFINEIRDENFFLILDVAKQNRLFYDQVILMKLGAKTSLLRSPWLKALTTSPTSITWLSVPAADMPDLSLDATDPYSPLSQQSE